MIETCYLNMKEAGAYLGQSYRWMQRHWVDLVQGGVVAYRVPKNAEKGRLVFQRESLDLYLGSCRVGQGKTLTFE